MREVSEFRFRDVRLFGTLHRDPAASGGAHRDTALLLINFAQASRAGIGDLSAWIADHVAKQGYLAFRYDFPGLGDTRGDAPEFGLPLWRYIRDGGHVEFAGALVEHLCRTHGIRRFVLGGLCAGAVTAVYTAALNPKTVAGVALMDPVFNACEEPPGRDPLRRERTSAYRERKHSIRERIKRPVREWVFRSSPTHWSRHLYTMCERAVDLTRGRRRPKNANRPLLKAYESLVRSRTPILLMNSGREGRVMHNLCFLGLDFRRHLDWRIVERTNHLMVTNGGREGVTGHIVTWLEERFPTWSSESGRKASCAASRAS